jgi:hypothetical protein
MVLSAPGSGERIARASGRDGAEGSRPALGGDDLLDDRRCVLAGSLVKGREMVSFIRSRCFSG